MCWNWCKFTLHTLHVVGNSLLDGELQINDICKPNGGLSINNNIGNMLSVDKDEIFNSRYVDCW